MKPLLISALTAALLLPAFSLQPSALSAPAPAIVAQAKAAPLLLYVKSIRRATGTNSYKIQGYIVNQSGEDQQVNTFDYKLWDRNTRKYVAISSGMIYKSIPPGGKVVFDDYIDKGDVGNIAPSRLVLELTKFN
jgi:hypothetical protein